MAQEARAQNAQVGLSSPPADNWSLLVVKGFLKHAG